MKKRSSILPFADGPTSHSLRCYCRQSDWGNSGGKRETVSFNRLSEWLKNEGHSDSSQQVVSAVPKWTYDAATTQSNIRWVPGRRPTLRGNQTASSALLHPEEPQTHRGKGSVYNPSPYKDSKYVFYRTAQNENSMNNTMYSSSTTPVTHWFLVQLLKFLVFTAFSGLCCMMCAAVY